MPDLITYAAWLLALAMVISLGYEIYRVFLRSGESKYDTLSHFIKQDIPLYISAIVVILLLFSDVNWSAMVGLGYCIILILIAGFYYNPRIMHARKPRLIDWLENLVYSGLIFAAGTLLVLTIV